MHGEPLGGMGTGLGEADLWGARRPVLIVASTLVAAMALVATVATTARPATADIASPADQTAYFIGQERADRDVPPLTRVDALDDIAQAHAERLARRSRLFHNPDLAELASPWVQLAENVGRGTSIRVVHEGFMASDAHRPHIVNPDYTQLGVGVAGSKDGQVYVVHVFRTQDADTAAPPPTTPAPAPPPPSPPAPAPVPGSAAVADPAPAPAPEPAPSPVPPPSEPMPVEVAPPEPAGTAVASASSESIEVALVAVGRDPLPPGPVQVAVTLLVVAGGGVAHAASRSRRATLSPR